jgi:cytochrome P450
LAHIKTVLGQGLALADGENHKRQRKMMNPAFSHNNIKVCIYVMVPIVKPRK